MLHGRVVELFREYLPGDVRRNALNTDKVTIKIPRPLYKKLQAIIADTDFGSVNQFVVQFLRDLVVWQGGDEASLSAQEVKSLKERLRSLGYL